jgi:hypothetical protein
MVARNTSFMRPLLRDDDDRDHEGDCRQLPRQAIVHGQNLRPRENDLKSLDVTDVSPLQAAEIDRLYRELLHCSLFGLPTNPSANG